MHRLCGHDVPEWAIVLFGRGRGDLQMRTKPTMHKRMLRSALVAAFSAAVALGALSGLSGTKGDVAGDSSWSTTAAPPGDSSWVIVADDVPGDSSWVAPEDSSWLAPTDSSWAVPS